MYVFLLISQKNVSILQFQSKVQAYVHSSYIHTCMHVHMCALMKLLHFSQRYSSSHTNKGLFLVQSTQKIRELWYTKLTNSGTSRVTSMQRLIKFAARRKLITIWYTLQHLELEVCPHDLFDTSHSAVVTEYPLHHTSLKFLLYVFLEDHQLPVAKKTNLIVHTKHNFILQS